MHDAAVLLEPAHSHHAFHSSEMMTQMNIEPSDRLNQILQSGEDFYHRGQETNKMLRDHSRRLRMSHDSHRKALLPSLQEHGSASLLQLNTTISTEINPFDVTLTMQIYDKHGYHSLYKRSVPDSLPQIMKDTDTLIRFPDRLDQGASQCQVLIKGPLSSVEIARSRLRALTNISVSFNAENRTQEYGMNDLREWLEGSIRELKLPKNLDYEIVPPRRKQFYEKITVRVSGAYSQGETMVMALSKLRNALYGPVDFSEIMFITKLTVPTSQMDMYMGGDQAEQLVAIARCMDVFLHFLPPNYESHYTDFRDFIITGKAPENVITALKMMTALQPIQLSFDVLNEDLVQQADRTQTKKIFDENNCVHIVVSPSVKQAISITPEDPIIHFVCMTTQEYNVGSIYAILKNFLRIELEMDREFVTQKPPMFMAPIAKDLYVSSRFLDIQNSEFPDAILHLSDEKGDVLLLEKSVDVDDADAVYPDVSSHAVSNVESDSYLAYQKGALEYLHAQEVASSVPRELFSSRSYIDSRYDPGSYNSNRGYYNNRNHRGSRRPSGNYMGDRRSGYPRNRYNKDRDINDKNDYPRNRNDTDRNDTRGDDSRRAKWYSKSNTRNAIDEYSLDGYLHYFINPRKDQDWRKSQDKILLMKKKQPGSHNSTMEEDTELPKRMAVRDLIDKAKEELSFDVCQDYSDNSRMSYAKMVGGASRKANIEENDSSSVDSKEKGRRRSYSSSETKYPAYGRDSPFSAGVRQLDRRVDVDHVLFSLNCDKYLENFRKAKVMSLPMLLKLEEHDLLRLGVLSSLDRNTIMEYIQKLRFAQTHAGNHAVPSRSPL